jgi:hypothetical protein
MTRPQLWTTVLLIATCGTPAAIADTSITYDINFTGTGLLPTAGSFTYDSTVPSFSDFTVTWAGVVLNFTAAANAPTLTPPDPTCLGAATGAAATFDLLSGDCDSPPRRQRDGLERSTVHPECLWWLRRFRISKLQPGYRRWYPREHRSFRPAQCIGVWQRVMDDHGSEPDIVCP